MLTVGAVFIGLVVAFTSAAWFCQHFPHIVDDHPNLGLPCLLAWHGGIVWAFVWVAGRLS